MRYWDASGIVSLCARDGHYEIAGPLINDDGEIVTWWGTLTEGFSAFARLKRSGEMSGGKELSSGMRLRELAGNWIEIQPSDALRELANKALWRHELKAMDAFQLAAALVWGNGRGDGLEFVTFDQRLARAAAWEGFKVLPAYQEA